MIPYPYHVRDSIDALAVHARIAMVLIRQIVIDFAFKQIQAVISFPAVDS